MLNPLSIQSLQSNTGKSLSAAELVRALPLNTPTNITVKQAAPHPSQPKQFTLQVQLGSSLYQLNSNQSLPAGSTASLTRTAGGQLILNTAAASAATNQAINTAPIQGRNVQLQPINQPATTQTKPIQQTSAGSQPGHSQTIAPDQKPIVQITAGQHSRKDSQSPPTPANLSSKSPGQEAPRPPPVRANIESRISADLNRQLPLNRPVLVTIGNTVNNNNSNSQPSAGNSQNIYIGDKTLQLNTAKPFPVGEKALLIRVSPQQVVLQTIGMATQSPAVQQSINNALRHVLPSQQPVAAVLQQMQNLAQPTGGANEASRSPINSILSSLLNLFAVRTDGSSEANQSIQQNLNNGGLFTERRIADPAIRLPVTELKGKLSELLQQADKLPEQPRQQMIELVKGLLNRVTSHQLESIQNTKVGPDGAVERFFALDLPIQHRGQLDNVELRISEHRQQHTKEEWQVLWRVKLHFDMQEQGTIDAELILEQEYQVTAKFWCSHPETVQQMEKRLERFNEQMEEKGFAIQALHCSEGIAPKPDISVDQLIDVIT